VVPILNGRRLLRSCIASILAQRDGRPFEIIAVDDGSTDGSLRLLEARQAAGQLTLLHGEGRGAAAAINRGIRAAVHPIICQIDQDVVLQSGWLAELLPAFEDGEVAAAQGHYITRPGAGFWARAMGRDLEHRYSRIRGPHVNHVCTGNTAYRASALHQVGLLDEQLGYGYDNDLSYRLIARGYRLVFQRRAVSVHVWREGFAGYLRQQFGVGYGRLDVVARHPHRVTGDDVSGALMMAHGPATLLAIAALLAAAVFSVTGGAWMPALWVAGTLMAVLTFERACSGIVAWRRTGDSAALGFAIAHLARDLAWAYAISLWIARRLLGRAAKPAHSMPRVEWTEARRAATPPTRGELLAVVPAFNENASLGRVIADLARVIPREDIVIVNDGSTDGTADLLPELGVRWLTLSQQLGVGGAVRAGIRYAERAGYQFVVRIDGDAQHRACDIPRLFRAVASGRADVALGSRHLRRGRRPRGWRRVSQAILASCLSVVTRRRVTDPTSGFWLFGPRALRLLGRNHPAGYAEPELVMFLHRNGLRLAEVPIRMRPRLAGQTSLTTPRAALAFARTMLAIVVVPLRRLAEGSIGD
jgi:glycosyltransferase involved in cell wall biosynthesis